MLKDWQGNPPVRRLNLGNRLKSFGEEAKDLISPSSISEDVEKLVLYDEVANRSISEKPTHL
jgi:hypothetical protein